MSQICFLTVILPCLFCLVAQRSSRPAQVRGVDLFPPPIDWMPPNCIFEVDDILQEWTWREKFNLIHLRLLLGAFTPAEWQSVYKKCYE